MAPLDRAFAFAGRNDAHALSASARDGFKKHGIAHILRVSLGLLAAFDGIVGAGNGGDVGAARELPAGGLRAERFHGLGGRTDEGKAGFGAGARQSGIFRKKSITGMNGVAT